MPKRRRRCASPCPPKIPSCSSGPSDAREGETATARRLRLRNERKESPAIKFRFYDTDDQGTWFEIFWEDGTTSFQLQENLPTAWPIRKARSRGYGTLWTFPAGSDRKAHTGPKCLTAPCDQHCVTSNGKRDACVSQDIKYREEEKWCTVYALLNVLGVGKEKAKRVKKATFPLGDLGMLADKAAGILGVNLVHLRPYTVNHVLRQKTGKLILHKGIHCVSADCDKGLIFDCSKPRTIALSRHSLAKLGFSGRLDDLRKIVRWFIKE